MWDFARVLKAPTPCIAIHVLFFLSLLLLVNPLLLTLQLGIDLHRRLQIGVMTKGEMGIKVP
jgi:hypothetical protein